MTTTSVIQQETAESIAPPRLGTGIKISGISVNLRHLVKGAPSLKLIVDGDLKHRRSFNHGDLILRWELKPAFIIHKQSTLTIRLNEHPLPWSRKTIAEFSISFEDAQRLLLAAGGECKDHKIGGDPEIRIDFGRSDPLHPDTLGAAANVLGEYKTTLDRLGRSRGFFETLLSLGTVVAEMDPIAKAVLGCVNALYKCLEDGEVRHKSLLDLIENMTCTLAYVEDIEQFARLEQLKEAIKNVRPLVEETTNFVLKYSSTGELAKLANSILSLSDGDQINDLSNRFEQFKLRFDRGVSVQSAVTAEKLLGILTANQDDALIAQLKPPSLEYGSRVKGCMKGTRRDIMEEIDRWANDLEAPNIFWLKGHPGIGKSAIASSVVQQLRESMRLGSNFFFQRANAASMTPSALWRAVAHDLGRQYPTIKKHLIATLKSDPNITSTVEVDELFRQLIQGPLLASGEIPIGRLPVIVIDALDECGGLDGQYSESRKSLLQTLETWSRLPGKFKLFVTGRGESDIERLFSKTRPRLFEVHAGEDVHPQSSEDINTFLKLRFQQIAAPYPELAADWPGTQTTKDLTKMAGGLFIWAKTVTDFAERGDPEEQLELILKGDGTSDMATLYSLILKTSFPNPTDGVIECFRSILGAVILTKAPIPTQSLLDLLSLKDTTTRHICNGLKSVMDSQDTLRVHHQSFVDFLIDQKKCPPAFYIDAKHGHQTLATACLRAMNDHLQFNPCNFDSSCLRNVDIPDLATRVEECITHHLSYSCHFWADHLKEARFDQAILCRLQTFMDNQFLYWLEAMSLMKGVGRASKMLLSLHEWMQTNIQDETMAREMHRFVTTFASVISQSAPHIYLSALPFSPRNSPLSKRYLERYPRTVTIQSGGFNDWPPAQNVLFGHTDKVTSVAFSPDGRRVVSSSLDQTVRLWDAETGEAVGMPFQGHTGNVWSVVFSSNGKFIASGSWDKTVRIWDANTGEAIGVPFRGHTDGIWSIKFSPDSKHIVSGSGDNTLRFWDVESGHGVGSPFQGHTNEVTSVAFSPNGQRIASGSKDRTIRIWETETGKEIKALFNGHTDMIWSVAFSPDGRRAVSGSADMTVRIWDAETGQTIGAPFQGHSNSVRSVSFSPEGTSIISGSSDTTLRLWDSETGEELRAQFEGHSGEALSVAFSADSNHVVSGSTDKTVRIWSVEVRKVDGASFQGHSDEVFSVAFSPNGQHVVSGSADRTIRVWDAENGEAVRAPFKGHTDVVECVAFSPDGERIISGSWDRSIRVWDTNTGKAIGTPFYGHTDHVWSVAFSPDAKYVISGSKDMTVRVWEVNSGEEFVGLFQGHTREIASVSFSPNGERIVSGSWDKTVRVWDFKTRKAAGMPFQGHTDVVMSVSFSPDGQSIVSGSSDMTVRIWDAETGETVGRPLRGHTEGIFSVAFSPDGKHIVSGSMDRTIRIWDVVARKGVRVLQGHTNYVHSVSFSPDGSRVVSGSTDTTVRVWDIQRGSTNSLMSSSRIENGWIVGPNFELLFWVPPQIHTGLIRGEGALVIGRIPKTKLDLTRFVYGESWASCKR